MKTSFLPPHPKSKEIALNHWDRISRSVANHKPYSTTFQTSHFVPQTQPAKILTFPENQNDFPHSALFSWNFKSGQDTECHRNPPRQKGMSCFLFSMIHAHTHTHMTTPSKLGRWQWKKQVKVPTLKMCIHFQALSTQNTFIQSKSFLLMSIPS